MFLKREEGYRRIKHQRIKRFGEYSKIRTAIRGEPVKLVQCLRGGEI
jgi:hypothetical protein